MDLRREEQRKALEGSAERKPKRFRIVRLEDRIAPSGGNKGTNNTCYWTNCKCIYSAMCSGQY